MENKEMINLSKNSEEKLIAIAKRNKISQSMILNNMIQKNLKTPKKRGRKPISKEMIKNINSLSKKGLSTNEIALKLTISKRTVMNYKKDKKQIKKQIDLETIKQIKKLSKKYNISQISQILGICRQTVRNYQ